MRITSRKFLLRCPECGADSDWCHWRPVENDGQTWATQEGSCNRCDAMWTEVYMASHIEIDKPAQRWANGAVKFEKHEDDDE